MFQPMSLVGRAALLALFISSFAWAAQLYSLGFRSAEGEFKGWFLDWSDAVEELADADLALQVSRLILVREPKVVRQFAKYPVSK